MASIQFATVLPGAKSSRTNNVNPTFRGFILLDGGIRRHAYIKDLNLEQLVNELLAYRLASELGLPVPDSYLCHAPTGNLAAQNCPLPDGSGHLTFASADVGTPNLAQQLTNTDALLSSILIGILRKWPLMGDAYAFDTWIANTDRHRGNLLISGPENIWLIDHGHAFTGPNWQATDLQAIADYRNRLSEWLTNVMSSDDKQKISGNIGVISTRIAAIDIQRSLDDSHCSSLLTPDALTALHTFLTERVQHVPAKAKSALGVPVLV